MSEELEYACTNDACSRYNLPVYLGSEAGEAVCKACGWMLSATYEGGS